jgi:hypothetical protein
MLVIGTLERLLEAMLAITLLCGLGKAALHAACGRETTISTQVIIYLLLIQVEPAALVKNLPQTC